MAHAFLSLKRIFIWLLEFVADASGVGAFAVAAYSGFELDSKFIWFDHAVYGASVSQNALCTFLGIHHRAFTVEVLVKVLLVRR